MYSIFIFIYFWQEVFHDPKHYCAIPLKWLHIIKMPKFEFQITAMNIQKISAKQKENPKYGSQNTSRPDKKTLKFGMCINC